MFLIILLMQQFNSVNNYKFETAVLAGGCFWCTEAVYEQVEGVVDVVSGYAGGVTENPKYEEVSTGKTGHTECVKITYDPDKIKYEQLLEIFWKVHDPTTLNRQGADVGTQYRSVIFYLNEEQKKIAINSKLNAQKNFKDSIVTEIIPLKKFYLAEDYHQNYYRNNPDAPYCIFVINPKLNKLKKEKSGNE